jgi:hypothetical protein
MFPSVSYTPASTIIPPSKFQTEDPVKLFNSLGYYYSITLSQQIDELQTLSNEVFQDIQKDFDDVAKRFDEISSKVKNLRERAKPVLTKLASAKPEVFAKNKSVKMVIAEESSNSNYISMELKNPLVIDLYNKAKPAPTLEPWKQLIPDYKKLDKLISNPEAFMDQFRAEMLQDFKNLVNAPTKSGGGKKKEKKEPQIYKVDQSLNVMIAKVLPLPQLVLQPPPVGKTQGWRQTISFKTVALDGNEEESYFSSSTIKPAVLSAPKSRVEKPKVVSRPVQQTDTAPAQQPVASYAPAPPPRAAPQISNAAPPPPPPAAAPPSAAAPPPPPPPPPPPTAAAPPPPPPPAAAPPPGPGVATKKVTIAPPPSSGATHLDLIKQGNFKLKKVTERAPETEKPVEEIDPSKLSTAELLQYMASIRAAVKDDEDEEEDEEESESESW